MCGGASTNGVVCGLFCVNGSIADSAANWRYGAALSFKLIASYYIFRGGSSVNSDLCGILFLYTGNIASNTGWNIGATLLFCFILSYSWWCF